METREILMKSDGVSVVFEPIEGDKIRVTTSSWDDAKMILRKQVLAAAMIGKGRLGWSGSTSRSLTWTSTTPGLLTRVAVRKRNRVTVSRDVTGHGGTRYVRRTSAERMRVHCEAHGERTCDGVTR